MRITSTNRYFADAMGSGLSDGHSTDALIDGLGEDSAARLCKNGRGAGQN